MLYFAYGSNLNKLQMQRRCPESAPIAKVKLKGYELVFNRVADIVENEKGVVHGAVYHVSDRDVINLDIYEGYPRLYEKVNVEVEDDEGSIYEVFAYVMVKKDRGEPNENYYNTIKQGFKDWNLPMKSLVKAKMTCKETYENGVKANG